MEYFPGSDLLTFNQYHKLETKSQLKKSCTSQVWWCLPVSPALGRLRQEDHWELEASLGYISKLTSVIFFPSNYFLGFFSLIAGTKYLTPKMKKGRVYLAHCLWRFQSIINLLQGRVAWHQANTSRQQPAKVARASGGVVKPLPPYIVCRPSHLRADAALKDLCALLLHRLRTGILTPC